MADPNNNHKNKQPRLIKPPIFSVEPSSTTNNNNNNNNNTEPSPKPLQPHFCEQIELIIKNADRAVFLPRREEIVRAFMKNPKDINYAKKTRQGVLAVPLTKKIVEENDEYVKFELSVLLLSFKQGGWKYKPKTYKKMRKRPQPQSSIINNPHDIRRSGSSNMNGTPSYYGMSPSPSASPPMG